MKMNYLFKTQHLISIIIIFILISTSGCIRCVDEKEEEINDDYAEIMDHVQFSISSYTGLVIDGQNLTITMDIVNDCDKTINDDLENGITLEATLTPKDRNMVFTDMNGPPISPINLDISDDFSKKLSVQPHSSRQIILSQKINSTEIKDYFINQKRDVIIKNLFGNYSVDIQISAFHITYHSYEEIGKYDSIYYEDIGRYNLNDVKIDIDFEVKNFVVC